MAALGSLRCVSVMALLALMLSPLAQADPMVTLTNVTPTTLSGPDGTSQMFTGTLTNTGTTDLTFLYGFWSGYPLQWGWPSPIGYQDLPIGASFTGDLVDFTLAGGTHGPYAAYFGFGFFDPAGLAVCGQLSPWDCYLDNPDFLPYVVQTNLIDVTGVVEPVPEPGTLLLLGSGLLGAAGIIRRKLHS